MNTASLLFPDRSIHFDNESGELFTCYQGVPETTIAIASQSAVALVSKLTDEERAHAKGRGFSALHEIMDANELLPFCGESDDEAFWNEWSLASTTVIRSFWNRVITETTAILTA